MIRALFFFVVVFCLFFRTVIFNLGGGGIYTPEDSWQYLETFLVFTGQNDPIPISSAPNVNSV